MRNYLLVTSVLFLFFNGITQTRDYFSLHQFKGPLLPIFEPFPDSKGVLFTELSYNHKTDGSKFWHKSLGYPVISGNLIVGDLGNKEVLGQSISATVGATFDKDFGERFGLDAKLQMGLGFFNKPFHHLTNPTNTVIGARTSALVGGTLRLRYAVSQNIRVSLAGGFWHYSNGHTKAPNIGANMPVYGIGVNYVLKENVSEKSDYELPKWVVFTVAGGVGMHEIEGTVEATGGPKYTIATVDASAGKVLGNASKLSVSLEYNWYQAYSMAIYNNSYFSKNYFFNSSTVIAYVGHELFFGRFALLTQAGVNVFNPFMKRLQEVPKHPHEERVKSELYNSNRFGVRYYLSGKELSLKQKVYTELSLKTIAGKADFVQLKLGYSF